MQMMKIDLEERKRTGAEYEYDGVTYIISPDNQPFGFLQVVDHEDLGVFTSPNEAQVAIRNYHESLKIQKQAIEEAKKKEVKAKSKVAIED